MLALADMLQRKNLCGSVCVRSSALAIPCRHPRCCQD